MGSPHPETSTTTLRLPLLPQLLRTLRAQLRKGTMAGVTVPAAGESRPPVWASKPASGARIPREMVEHSATILHHHLFRPSTQTDMMEFFESRKHAGYRVCQFNGDGSCFPASARCLGHRRQGNNTLRTRWRIRVVHLVACLRLEQDLHFLTT
jgi:hypothetical protein